MTWRNEINKFVGRLPATTCMVRVRIGDNALSTCATVSINGRRYNADTSEFEPVCVDIEDLSETLISVLCDAGMETDYRKARLHAHTTAGKQSGTKTLTAKTGRVAEMSGSDRAIEQLTGGLLGMASQMQKSFKVVCDALSHEHERSQVANQMALDSRVDAIDAEGKAKFLEHMIDSGFDDEGPHDDTMRDHAGVLLSQVVNHITGVHNQPPTADQIKNYAATNPDWLRDLVRDPTIAAAIYESFKDYNPGEDGEGVNNDTPDSEGPTPENA